MCKYMFVCVTDRKRKKEREREKEIKRESERQRKREQKQENERERIELREKEREIKRESMCVYSMLVCVSVSACLFVCLCMSPPRGVLFSVLLAPSGEGSWPDSRQRPHTVSGNLVLTHPITHSHTPHVQACMSHSSTVSK